MTLHELHQKLSTVVGIYPWSDTHIVDRKLANIGLYNRRYISECGMAIAYWLCEVSDQKKPVIVFTSKEDVPSSVKSGEFSLVIITDDMRKEMTKEDDFIIFNKQYMHPDIAKYL